MSREVSAVSGSFVDPLKLKPVRLSVGAVQHLLERRYFAVHPGSPLVALAALKVSADEKNGKELLKLGIPAQPDPDARLGGKGKMWFDALKVAGAPEARLEYTELAGPATKTFDMVLGAGLAVMVELDTAGLNLSPALPYADVLKPMARHLQNAELGFPNLNVWQSQLKTIGWVFANNTKLPKAVFEQRAATAGKTSAAEAAKVTQQLIAAELITQSGDTLALNAQLKAFIERSVGGQVCELMVTPYDAKGKAGERRELRFIGKPNDRITALTLKGEALKAALKKEPEEPLLVSIMSLGKEPLRSFIESFVGLA